MGYTRSFALMVALVLLAPLGAVGQTENIHIQNELGSYSYWVGLWPGGNRSLAGQSFTVTGSDLLNRFSFWVERRCMTGTNPNNCTNPDETFSRDQTFAAHVGVWNASENRVTSVVWSGLDRTLDTMIGNSPEQLWFNTGPLGLSAGTYIAFLTYTGATEGLFGIKRGTDTYAGGSNIAGVQRTEGGDQWAYLDTPYSSYDAYDFRAEFTAVPEPSTWLMLATGLLGLGLVARRRKERGAVGDTQDYGLGEKPAG